MIADELGFKDNFKTLLMTERGHLIPLIFKHAVLLGFYVLVTHSESISAWPFNTKKVENIKKMATKRHELM